MAAVSSSGDTETRVVSDVEVITDPVPEASEVSEPSEKVPKSEESAELRNSAEAENGVTDDLKVATVPETPVEDKEKEPAHVEGSDGVDKIISENVDSSADATANSEKQSTKPVEPPAADGTFDDSKMDVIIKKNVERKARNRRGRGVLLRRLTTLNLPEGVILVKDRRYTGYHCTYCNCVLRSLVNVKAHIGGRWHKRTLQIKAVNGSKKGKPATPVKSAGTAATKALPKEPLKSSLEEYLSTTKSAIVGLGYIIETQRPDKQPTFQCNLCEVSFASNDIKEHISGMKHSLMYLKLVQPTQLAELLAKQMSKAEKNKEISEISAKLEKENGRGEITVKISLAKDTTDVKQPGNRSNRFRTGRNRFPNNARKGGDRFFNRPQVAGNRSRLPFARPKANNNNNQKTRNTRGARRDNFSRAPQRKRGNEGLNPIRKRQFLERDYQARMQYGMERVQNDFFPGAWGMGNKPMNMGPYQNEADFYSGYPNFYPSSYGERRSFGRQGYMNEPYERVSHFSERDSYRGERYDDRQSYWSDRRDSFAPSRPRGYNSRLVSPVHRGERSGDPNVQISALKRLAGFNLTSDEDAGVVINAINSLTNSFMNYKLRDLSGPVQQLLQKSLKSSDLTSLLDLPDKSSGGSRDRYGGRSSSSQMNRDWGISQIAKPQNWMF